MKQKLDMFANVKKYIQNDTISKETFGYQWAWGKSTCSKTRMNTSDQVTQHTA